jgi:hypothetical protein
MIFLIQYDRKAGRIVTIQRYADDQRSLADRVRLELEIGLVRRRRKDEVVILDAASEAALRKTHRRYFEDLEALANVS